MPNNLVIGYISDYFHYYCMNAFERRVDWSHNWMKLSTDAVYFSIKHFRLLFFVVRRHRLASSNWNYRLRVAWAHVYFVRLTHCALYFSPLFPSLNTWQRDKNPLDYGYYLHRDDNRHNPSKLIQENSYFYFFFRTAFKGWIGGAEDAYNFYPVWFRTAFLFPK